MGVQTTTRDNGSPSFVNMKISSVTGLNDNNRWNGETRNELVSPLLLSLNSTLALIILLEVLNNLVCHFIGAGSPLFQCFW